MSLIYEALQKAKRDKEVAKAVEEGRMSEDDARDVSSSISISEREAAAYRRSRYDRSMAPRPENEPLPSNGAARRVWLPLMVMGTLLCLSAAMTVFAFYLIASRRDVMPQELTPQPTPQIHVVTVTPVPTATPLPVPPPPTPVPVQPVAQPATQPATGPVELPVVQKNNMTPPQQGSAPANVGSGAPMMAPDPPLHNVSLTCILTGGPGGTGLCIINGRTYSAGETKDGITVKEVHEDHVVVIQDNGLPVTLRVK